MLAFGRAVQGGVGAGVLRNDIAPEIERDLAIEAAAPRARAGDVGVAGRAARGQHHEVLGGREAHQRCRNFRNVGENVGELLPAFGEGRRQTDIRIRLARAEGAIGAERVHARQDGSIRGAVTRGRVQRRLAVAHDHSTRATRAAARPRAMCFGSFITPVPPR